MAFIEMWFFTLKGVFDMAAEELGITWRWFSGDNP